MAYTQIPDVKRDKLNNTSFKGVFVGYTQTTRQYRILNPADSTVKLFSSVRFNESAKGGLLCLEYTPLEPYQQVVGTEADDSPFMLDEGERDIEDLDMLEIQDADQDQELEQDLELIQSRSSLQGNRIAARKEQRTQGTDRDRVSSFGRKIILSERAREQAQLALRVDYQPQVQPETPSSFREAIQGKDARRWKLAIQEHLDSLGVNHSCDVVDAPAGANLVDTKWVFKVKRLPNGQVDKFKARLCARGFTQEYGIDYFETFSPVVRMESLRILLAIAAEEDLEAHQMDAVSAYLLGTLDEEVYAAILEGLQAPDSKALRLVKGMPGLKQLSRVWNKTIGAFFENFGLRQLPAD